MNVKEPSNMEKQSEALEVRKANAAETRKVLEFYHAMIDEMQGTDFDVLWKRDVHPSDAFLSDAMARGYLYVGIAEDGCIASALVIDRSPAPGYENVPWEVEADANEAGILHSVATRPAYHGRGFAKLLLQGAIDSSRDEGLKALRLDTFVDNVRSHGLYERLGFRNLGTFQLFYDDLGDIDLDMFELAL